MREAITEQDTDPLTVLARGEGWIVVAKPPGVITHRNAWTRKEYAMLQRVRDQVGALVYPIHRLDRPTSGCLLFAIEQALAGPLHAALRAGEKRYLAFVRGTFRPDGRVVVETPMKDEKGISRDARSEVWCLGRSLEPRCSLLEVRPFTGRYHQVRRHVRDLTHPVINDAEHGDTKVNRWWRATFGVHRLGLHSHQLSLTLPDGSPLEVVCPLFEDQAAIWRQMPWWRDAVTAQPILALPPLPLPLPAAES